MEIEPGMLVVVCSLATFLIGWYIGSNYKLEKGKKEYTENRFVRRK